MGVLYLTMSNVDSPKKPVSDDWHPADIKAALEKAGWSLRRLSLHNGFSDGLLKHALHRPYPRAERMIARAIGVKPQDIWPSRYDNRRPKRGIGGAPTHKKNRQSPAGQGPRVQRAGG